MKISDAARNAIVNAFTALIDAVSPPGICVVRTGSAPTNTTDADTGTLLATLTFSNPSFGAAATGTATANAIASDTDVDNTGTAGYFRIKNGAGTVVAQGSCGTSGADMNFDSVNFVQHGVAAISSMTVTMPAS